LPRWNPALAQRPIAAVFQRLPIRSVKSFKVFGVSQPFLANDSRNRVAGHLHHLHRYISGGHFSKAIRALESN
jgi:hypothetical protein